MVTLRPYWPDATLALLALVRDTFRRDYSPVQIATLAANRGTGCIDAVVWCWFAVGKTSKEGAMRFHGLMLIALGLVVSAARAYDSAADRDPTGL